MAVLRRKERWGGAVGMVRLHNGEGCWGRDLG